MPPKKRCGACGRAIKPRRPRARPTDSTAAKTSPPLPRASSTTNAAVLELLRKNMQSVVQETLRPLADRIEEIHAKLPTKTKRAAAAAAPPPEDAPSSPDAPGGEEAAA